MTLPLPALRLFLFFLFVGFGTFSLSHPAVKSKPGFGRGLSRARSHPQGELKLGEGVSGAEDRAWGRSPATAPVPETLVHIWGGLKGAMGGACFALFREFGAQFGPSQGSKALEVKAWRLGWNFQSGTAERSKWERSHDACLSLRPP